MIDSIDQQAGAQDADAMADDDLSMVFNAVVAAATEAISATEGGIVEVIRGAELGYQGVQGSLAVACYPASKPSRSIFFRLL